ncbi:MAG: hypothetical protein GIW95_02060 [Candidatus Eremiobacteraeota bacterium]|nr:hypothetical protein [Candidatus Eremiobacteraeota bacterium]
MRGLRIAGRVTIAAIGLVVVALIAIQYERIAARNVALSQSLASTRAEVSALREKQRRAQRRIDRLSDPRGAVPEIHDRLRFVGPHEELIYLKGAPAAPPAKPDVP